MNVLKIGEVARRADVGVETIRYYERQGLLESPQRRASGYRQYDESVISRLHFIRRAKNLGFTLAEIRELLGLWCSGNTRCDHVRTRAVQKISDIDEKIRSLQTMRRSLQQIICQCERQNSVAECLLWEGLAQTPGADTQPAPAGRKSSVRKARKRT